MTDSFTTNDVDVYEGGTRLYSALGSKDFLNRFNIIFTRSTFPTSDSFQLADSTHAGNYYYVGVSFTYNGKTYVMPAGRNYYLSASADVGKAKYTLAPYWFCNYYDSNDSALIHGTFIVP